MLSFTTNQLAVLFLVLLLGWLLGLASRSGGGKWRRQYEEERVRADALQARVTDLERAREPIHGGTAASIGAAARGGRDDLTLIRGVGHEGEVRLNEAGYHRYAQVANMSEADARSFELRHNLKDGTITREEWREQAAALAHDPRSHRERWGDRV